MKLLACGLLMTSAAIAACPTSTDSKGVQWANTCFVSTTGSDTAGTGSWTAPFLTIGKGYTTMGIGTGDQLVVRHGRYGGDNNTIFMPSIAKCGAVLPCTIRSYPGDVVIIDGSSMSYRSFYMSKFGTINDTPIFSTDPKDGHWRFIGMRFEAVPTGPVWNQGITDDIVLKSIRSYAPGGGIAFATCGSCRIFGSYIEADGMSVQKGIEGAAFGCSGLFPTYYQSPWSVDGTTDYMVDYWQMVNQAPKVVGNDYPSGCNDLLVQDSTFVKRHSTAVDTFGFETANGVTLDRFHAINPAYQSDDTLWTLWGTQGGTDGIDIKGRNILITDSSSIGGKGSLKVWGAGSIDKTLVIGGWDTGEGALSGMQRYYQSGLTAEWPNNVEYRTIRDVFNDPITNDAIVYASKIAGGMGAIEGTEIIISAVPGCTGINGHKVIKHIYHGNGYPTLFSIQNTDGSQFTCPDAYDLSQQAFKINPSATTPFNPVIFTPGSTDVTVTGLTSAYLVEPNDRIRFTTAGSLPAGLSPGTDYWITFHSGTAVRLSTVRAGTPITFSDAGSGVHSAQIIDERTSYAGYMMIAPYSQSFKRMSILSKYRFAVDMCGGCDDRVGSSISWSFNNTIVSSPNTGTMKRAYFLVAKPRAFFTNANATINLEYFDAATLIPGKAVYFTGTCILPAPLQEKTPYYVVAADEGAMTIRVSASPGGTAISNYVNNAGCAFSRNFLIADGFTSPVVSVSANVFHVGDIVTAGSIKGNAPYPIVNGNGYYVATSTSITAGGSTFQQLTLKNTANDLAPLSFAAPPGRYDNTLSLVAPPSSSLRNFEVSSFTTLNPSGNNIYYASDSSKAYCGLNKINDGKDIQGSCATNPASLDRQETASVITNPALDYDATGRPTDLSPAATWNKGAYAGTDSVTPGATTALLEWRAPSAAESCTAGLYRDASLSNLVEQRGSAMGKRRQVIFGASTPLSAGTSYWYKVQCGYDVFTAPFQTIQPSGRTGTITVSLSATAGAAQAALETSPDGSAWTPGDRISCTSGCQPVSMTLSRDAAYWYRWTLFNSSGAVLSRSLPAAIIP